MHSSYWPTLYKLLHPLKLKKLSHDLRFAYAATVRSLALEHSNSRFESSRFDSLCESIRIDSFCKKSAFRFTSCYAVFALNK